MESMGEEYIDGGHDEIDWKDLDKSRFYFFGSFLFLGVRALVFPAALVKTRLQCHSRHANYSTALSTFRHVLRSEGIRGFYAGFPTTALGVLPAQALYLSTYEMVREKAKEVMPLPGQETYCNMIAGTCASLVSHIVVVPVDVVSQRLMVQGDRVINHDTILKGGSATAMHIFRTNGIRGFYRGLFTSLVTYAPSSGIWWATYGKIKYELKQQVDESDRIKYRVPIEATAGMCAGITAAIMTNPMDVLKTRIQVSTSRDAQTIRAAFKTLLKEDGMMGLANGLSAKILNSAPVSILMITVYELIKRLSVIDSPQQ